MQAGWGHQARQAEGGLTPSPYRSGILKPPFSDRRWKWLRCYLYLMKHL